MLHRTTSNIKMHVPCYFGHTYSIANMFRFKSHYNFMHVKVVALAGVRNLAGGGRLYPVTGEPQATLLLVSVPSPY